MKIEYTSYRGIWHLSSGLLLSSSYAHRATLTSTRLSHVGKHKDLPFPSFLLHSCYYMVNVAYVSKTPMIAVRGGSTYDPGGSSAPSQVYKYIHIIHYFGHLNPLKFRNFTLSFLISNTTS